MSERSTTTTRLTRRATNWRRRVALAALLLPAFLTVAVAGEFRRVTVADPYLELHTGPGRGYPKIQVVDRGESVEVIKRRTDWFLVRAEDGREGWVDKAQMENTLLAGGSSIQFGEAGQDNFTHSRWEIGMLSGDFGGANIGSLYAGYSLNPNVSIEVWGSQILGNFSNGWMASVNVVHETWPDWRISPFFTLGAGVVRTSPKSTIVQGEDRTDQIANAGVGFRVYATRRFLLRAEYKTYVVFTSRDENEEPQEWKVGFAFFFK